MRRVSLAYQIGENTPPQGAESMLEKSLREGLLNHRCAAVAVFGISFGHRNPTALDHANGVREYIHTYVLSRSATRGGDAIGPNSGSPSMARAEGMRVYVHTAGMPKAAPSKGRADRYSRVHALFQVSSRGRATVAGGGAMQTRF